VVLVAYIMLVVVAVGVECTNIGPYIHYIRWGDHHSIRETCVSYFEITMCGSLNWVIGIS